MRNVRAFLSPLLLAALAVVAGGSAAERADRGKPLTIEADSPSKLDIPKQVVTFNGNVVVTKGTMTIKADKVEVRETPEGYHLAAAIGTPAKPATFRQKRDGVDEWIEGRAERLDYDSRADVVRLSGGAQVRRLRGSTVADEITGAQISYDNPAEVFSLSGGASAADGGRVRAVLTPRNADGADAPASAPPPANDGKPQAERG